MLINTDSDAPIVRDLIEAIQAQAGDYFGDADEIASRLVDTREPIDNFVAAAHSHGLAKKISPAGVEYIYGPVKKSPLKNSTVRLYAIERDGWTVLLVEE